MMQFIKRILSYFFGPDVPVTFKTFIPGYEREGLKPLRYQFTSKKFTTLKLLLLKKLMDGIEQYGSKEAFIAAYEAELEEKRVEAETKVRVYEMRRRQFEWMKKNGSPARKV